LDFKEEAAKLERFWFKTSNIFIELLLLGFAKPRGSLKSVLAKCTSGPTLIIGTSKKDSVRLTYCPRCTFPTGSASIPVA
jgi:hypothetical protein